MCRHWTQQKINYRRTVYSPIQPFTLRPGATVVTSSFEYTHVVRIMDKYSAEVVKKDFWQPVTRMIGSTTCFMYEYTCMINE